MEKIEKYKTAAKKWAAMYKVEDEHAINIAASILSTTACAKPYSITSH